MERITLMMMVFSGLCFLPSCFPHLYILVKMEKTWDEAQSYCRKNYTDLASVHDQQDLDELNQLINKSFAWIGLHADTEAWRWSLENPAYYGEGEAEFRNWSHGEPYGGEEYHTYCVSVANGAMSDNSCEEHNKFICYNGTAGTDDTPSSYIFITEPKTWNEARSYCRTHYIDLTSVRNQAENDLMQMVTSGEQAWIGLYRDSWKWSDGSKHSFSYWISGAPFQHPGSCVISISGEWDHHSCSHRHPFVCYSEVTAANVRKQVVRVVLKKQDSSVDMEELKDGILEGLSQTLEEHGLSEDVKLRWVTQPDGKVFHKKEEKKSCGLKSHKPCVK